MQVNIKYLLNNYASGYKTDKYTLTLTMKKIRDLKYNYNCSK
jgi:hypothetical protein